MTPAPTRAGREGKLQHFLLDGFQGYRSRFDDIRLVFELLTARGSRYRALRTERHGELHRARAWLGRSPGQG